MCFEYIIVVWWSGIHVRIVETIQKSTSNPDEAKGANTLILAEMESKAMPGDVKIQQNVVKCMSCNSAQSQMLFYLILYML